MSNLTSPRVNVVEGDDDLDLSASEEMNGRSFADFRNDVHQRAMAVLAQSQHLNYRNSRNPATRYMASSSIVSSSSDEPTIDLNEPNPPYNFNPTEITGRSTATNDTSISVEQMLSESNISDVRDLADELKMFKFRESHGGEQVVYTADVSLTSSKSFRSSMSKPDDWDLNSQSDVSGVFMPSDKVKDFLKNEEELWAQEYAILPPEADGNSKKNGFESPNISRNRFGNESASESNASVGHFFTKRSANLVEMLPNRSPPKTGKPLALVDSLNASRDGTKVLPQNATYGQEGESFISHSAIASYFSKCQNDSPQTVSSNLMKLKKPKVPSAQSIPTSAVKPMADVLFVTEPIPFKPHNANSNVKILNVENFYGDVATLIQQSKNSQNPMRSTFLTPGGHIRKNKCNKENEGDARLDENVSDQNISSDTLSMSGILMSSSKVLGNSTKTSHTDAVINTSTNKSKDSVDPAISSVETKENDESKTTPTNSPIRNRKRTRSNERTTPTRQNTLDVLYNRNHRLTPSPNRNKVDSTHSTPETPRSMNNLDVLFNRKHRLTPSPKNGTIESVNTTPVTPVASFQNYGSRSNAYMDAPNGNMNALDNYFRSPKLLTQSNSQFSSVSDLREFSVKSSQSVLSWPSQKLRTASQKQFTIKNIGGKKLTMRIEVIGPGFQLSPPEPFQLIALQAQECRTISVVFCPIALGVAVGKLNFSHAKDTGDRNIRKMIPLFGYGGHTVVEVQGVSQGVVGNPFLQLGTIGDLMNLQISGTFSVYNKGPLRGVAIIRIKSDSKKPSGTSYSPLTITPSKCIIGPDSHTRIDVVYRPRKNDVRKLLRQEGNVLGVATLEIFMADEPSRQRILGLINKYAKNSSDIYLLEDLFRGIDPVAVENFSDFQETEEMIGELFNKMKSTEIVLTVKRSIMDQTIESEHDFFMSDTNESMLFHTMVSDEVEAPQMPPPSTATSNAINIASSSSTIHAAPHRHERFQADKWFLNKAEIRLNPYNVDLATTEIEIHSRSRNQQIFEIYSNQPEMFIIKPECGVISPSSTATFSVTIKNTILPSEALYIKVRMDKKQDAIVPVIIQKNL